MKLNDKVSYSAVAAAVALACGSPFVADAASLSSSTITMSQQGNALATASANTTLTVTVALSSSYIANDTAQLTIVGGNWQTASGAPPDATCSSGTFGGLSYDRSTNRANYRVTSGTPTSTSICTFVVAVQNASMGTAGNVTISYGAQTASSNLSFDSGSAITVARVVDQFSSSAGTLLNGVVNVNNARLHFVADESTGAASQFGGNEDHLGFTLNNSGSLANAATVSSIVATINGDFSFLDDDGTAGCSASDLTQGPGQALAVGNTGSLSINSACSVLTYTESSTLAPSTTGAVRFIALGKTGAATSTALTNEKIINNGSFSGSIVFNYGNGATSSETDSYSSLGSWTLNGASIDVAFMPYTEGTSRIINLTNRSGQTGAITVSAINESGVACAAFSAGSIAGNSIKNISADVDAGIRACYGATFAGRVALNVVANIPGSNAELYTGYNRNGSLSTIVNTSNGFGTR
jgi:hypothetical protein